MSSKRKSRSSTGSNTSTSRRSRKKSEEEDLVVDEEEDDVKVISFSQVEKHEFSQPIPNSRENEKIKFNNLNANIRNKAITNLSRLLLMKAFAGEHIDRPKCINEALKADGDALAQCKGTSNVLFECAAARLRNVFGFDLVSAPDFMKPTLKGKSKDWYYVVNKVTDEDGSHSRVIHDNESAAQRGLLMVVLALAYCKGAPVARAGGSSTSYVSRWITDEQLYRLLHSIDESIPEDPPMPNSTAKRFHKTEIDVDACLEKFVKMHYLLMENVEEGNGQGDGVKFAMGPRAALEIGRKQLVYFCAEILDEQPDPTMLAEIEESGGGDDDEDAEEDA